MMISLAAGIASIAAEKKIGQESATNPGESLKLGHFPSTCQSVDSRRPEGRSVADPTAWRHADRFARSGHREAAEIATGCHIIANARFGILILGIEFLFFCHFA